MNFIFHSIWITVAILVIGYTFLQVMGRKTVTQMTNFDLFVVIVLGITITEPITSKSLRVSVYYALVIAIVFLILSSLARNKTIKNVIRTSSVVLIRNGEIDNQGLRKMKLTVDELLALLRQKGYTDISDLALVMIEESGQLSAIPMSDKRSLQPNDLNISPSPMFIPIPLIMNGEIIEQNLNYVEKDRSWLTAQLQAYDLSMDSISKVTLATLNQRGFLDIDIEKPDEYKRGLYFFKPGDSS